VVVFAEHPYDGWTAAIDNAQAPLLRADYLFTAVAVERGRHTIVRRYFPPRLREGFAGTLVAAVALALVHRRLRATSRTGRSRSSASPSP